MKLTISSQGKILSAVAESDEEGSEYSILTGFNFFTLLEPEKTAFARQFINEVLLQSSVLSCRLRLNLHEASSEYVCFGIASGDKQTIHLCLQELPSDAKSQRKIIEAQMRLREFLNQLPLAVLIVEDGGSIRAVNPTAERMFGLNGPEFMSLCVFDLFDYDQSKANRPEYVKELANEPGSMTRLMGIKQVGRHSQLFPLELTIGTLDSKSGQYVMSIFDISERVAHEKMKQEFIAMVSHDLKAPLTCVRAGIGMLRHLDVDLREDSGQETLKELEEESDKLIRFIEDLLDLSRLESGRFVLNQAPTPLSSVFRQAAKSLSVLSDEQRVSILAPETELVVNADEERLVQVVTNLLSNAIKASPPDARPVTIECIDLGAHVEVRIKDHGCGLSAEDTERIFDKFIRVEDRAKSQSGTGLGLSICKAIIDQHGGNIGVESSLGEGATFWFRLLREM